MYRIDSDQHYANLTLRFGPLVSDARGSVGGATIARNSGGPYMRARVTPSYPASAKQVAQNALISQLNASWLDDVTPAQRTAWDGLASRTTFPNRLGDAIHLSGQNLYVRSNVMLDLTGQALVVDPPLDPVIPAPSFTLVHTPAVGIEVTAIGNWDESGGGQVLVFSSPAQRLTVNYYTGPYNTRFPFPSANFAILPENIRGSAALSINSRFFFRYRVVDPDGGVSFGSTGFADVGAVV